MPRGSHNSMHAFWAQRVDKERVQQEKSLQRSNSKSRSLERKNSKQSSVSYPTDSYPTATNSLHGSAPLPPPEIPVASYAASAASSVKDITGIPGFGGTGKVRGVTSQQEAQDKLLRSIAGVDSGYAVTK